MDGPRTAPRTPLRLDVRPTRRAPLHLRGLESRRRRPTCFGALLRPANRPVEVRVAAATRELPRQVGVGLIYHQRSGTRGSTRRGWYPISPALGARRRRLDRTATPPTRSRQFRIRVCCLTSPRVARTKSSAPSPSTTHPDGTQSPTNSRSRLAAAATPPPPSLPRVAFKFPAASEVLSRVVCKYSNLSKALSSSLPAPSGAARAPYDRCYFLPLAQGLPKARVWSDGRRR